MTTNKSIFVTDGIKISTEGRQISEGLKIEKGGSIIRSQGTNNDYTRRVSDNKTATIPPPPSKMK